MTSRAAKRPQKIFVVEDNKEVYDVLHIMLRNLSYHVCGRAENLIDAVEGIEKNDPDFVLVDISLNNTNEGLDVGSYLDTKKKIPFVYITAHDDDEILEKARATGPAGYLLKPFDKRQLMVALEMARGKERSPD